MSINENYQTDVVKLIKNYLKNHPESGDTLRGITRWWVQKQKFDDSVIAVDKALNLLLEEGVINAIERNGIIYYRLVNSSFN